MLSRYRLGVGSRRRILLHQVVQSPNGSSSPEGLHPTVKGMRLLRRPLSKKEKKLLLKKVEGLPWARFTVDQKVEEVKVRTETEKEYVVYFVEGKPTFWVKDDKYLPVLCGNDVEGPSVVVDKGAVPYVTRGADVMRPGIISFEGDFKKGDVVLVRSENLKFPIAVGLALYDKEEAEKMERGKVIKNLHYLGDDLFKLCKS
ncbi:RNA-binding protein, containing PUA domain [Ignicoccus hospitalis KIN4/I]|uniref:RNA-binding protein, containing PUA domain n=2 Tax=Ignicoccus TaxID=54258 RepID=A8A8F4_IGNH4|nr:RNA-binding protein, containing PUA domain [Ignicoccus hospitalis KIN4/I]